MSDVFLAYSHEDKRVAERIVRRLERVGLTVFWDDHLTAGTRFNDKLETELTNAGKVVVLWSKHSVSSDPVHQEAQLAEKLNRLVPVRIDGVEPVPGCEQHHYRDLSAEIEAVTRDGDDAEQPETERLVAEIRPQAEARRAAGERMRAAFHRRRVGDFEGAAALVNAAFSEFRDALEPDELRQEQEAQDFRKETLAVLETYVRERFERPDGSTIARGSIRPTLSGLSVLPVVDAKLQLRLDWLRHDLPPQCTIKRDIATRELLNIGIVVRPGTEVQDGVLITQLLEESEARHGPLELHCFLLIMNTNDGERAENFSDLAEERQLDAKCIIWTHEQGTELLVAQLRETVSVLCEDES